MATERPVNIPGVTRFVREVLGCNCPDEVFRRIEVSRTVSAVQSIPADYELRIGGRLLIVTTSAPVELLTTTQLEQAIAEGRRARDAANFNRFRLVVQSGNAARDEQTLWWVFETISARDEKTHLHVVDARAAPNFFL